MKLTLNIDDLLIEKVDKYAEENYINRTSAICVLLSSALKSNDITNKLAKDDDKNDFDMVKMLDMFSKVNKIDN